MLILVKVFEDFGELKIWILILHGRSVQIFGNKKRYKKNVIVDNITNHKNLCMDISGYLCGYKDIYVDILVAKLYVDIRKQL